MKYMILIRFSIELRSDTSTLDMKKIYKQFKLFIKVREMTYLSELIITVYKKINFILSFKVRLKTQITIKNTYFEEFIVLLFLCMT